MKSLILIACILLSTLLFYGGNKLKDNSMYIENKSNLEVSINSDEYKIYNKTDVLDSDKETAKDINTIVIDPGHSSIGNLEKEPIAPNSNETKAKDVLGATGVYTNIPEHITTVSISNLVKDNLINMGFNVIMTKTKIEESISNIERAKIGNDNNADLVVRIHADGSTDFNVKGASVLIPSKNEYTDDISDISKIYGEKIINTYTEELGLKNRGLIYRDNMTGFNWSDVPVVILEMGFLSNPEEDLFLSSEENHKSIADAISKSIYYCFQ